MQAFPEWAFGPASNCEVVIENVRVPKENLLGKEGNGFEIAMHALDGGRIGIGAQAVGIAQGALNEAIQYVKERKQFGKSIASFQNTKFKIAEMQTIIDAARLLVWRAAVAKQENNKDYPTMAAMCKLYASDIATRSHASVSSCLEVMVIPENILLSE